MASTAQIYGQIGAAKAFSSSVSNALDIESKENDEKIMELQQQLESATNERDRQRIQRKIRRLDRKNKRKAAGKEISNSVSNFLAKIASYMDIGVRTLIEWIAQVIVMVLPGLEVAVKMILLSNIKKMVSCVIDPTIPLEWRNNGVILNEIQVDPRKVLQASPYSKWGRYMYFGCYEDEEEYQNPRNVHELARAEDMNAFLWYAKNCAKFVSPNIISPDHINEYFDTDSGTTFFSKHSFKGRDNYPFIQGSTFQHYSDSSITFLCEKREMDGNNTFYTIVPATDTWTGITWYKDRTSLTGLEGYDYPSGKTKKKTINYDKSKPLFNIEYLGTSPEAKLFGDGNFRFRILPKPFNTGGGFIVDLQNNTNTLVNMANAKATELMGSELDDAHVNSGTTNYKFQGIQSPIPVTARFNGEGVYDRKGKYSINTKNYQVVQTENTKDEIKYTIYRTNSTAPACKMKLVKATKMFEFYDSTQQQIYQVLTECYFGNTVYEFNYDYIVSMRLFDAKSIATGIVDALLNVNLPNPFKKSRSHSTRGGDDSEENTISNVDQIRIDSYVDRMVEKMIDTEDKEYTDCFYTFSNEDYEAMEQQVVDKIANSTLIDNGGDDTVQAVYDILNQYEAKATLNEKQEVITTALTKAAEICGYGIGTSTGGSTGIGNDSIIASNGRNNYQTPGGSNKSFENFLIQAVQFLTSSVVNAILTPKVLMLIQVNRMLMGTDVTDYKENYNYSVTDVLKGLDGVMKSVIRQVIDTIQKELLRLILERLSDMVAGYMKRLGLEYAMKWVNLLKQLLMCFKFNRNSVNAVSNGGVAANGTLGNTQYSEAINAILDQVDYADIDVLVDEIMPKTNPC